MCTFRERDSNSRPWSPWKLFLGINISSGRKHTECRFKLCLASSNLVKCLPSPPLAHYDFVFGLSCHLCFLSTFNPACLKWPAAPVPSKGHLSANPWHEISGLLKSFLLHDFIQLFSVCSLPFLVFGPPVENIGTVLTFHNFVQVTICLWYHELIRIFTKHISWHPVPAGRVGSGLWAHLRVHKWHWPSLGNSRMTQCNWQQQSSDRMWDSLDCGRWCTSRGNPRWMGGKEAQLTTERLILCVMCRQGTRAFLNRKWKLLLLLSKTLFNCLLYSDHHVNSVFSFSILKTLTAKFSSRESFLFSRKCTV